MSPDIKVSIIVPIYNVEKYLEKCLESLRAQNLCDIEVICVNDGSTDGSALIAQKFCESDKRFRLVNKLNSGYGHTVNLGISNAIGEYIGIVESDDFVKPEMFSKLYSVAKNFNVDVVKSNFYMYWSTPAESTEAYQMITPAVSNKIINPHEVKDVFEFKPTVWSAIYKKSFLSQNSIKFQETPGASYQDLGFSFKVWACAKSVYLLEDYLIYYRQDNETSSVNSKSKVFCVCDEYREIERFLVGRNDLPQYLNKLVSKLKYHSYSWNLNRIAIQFRREFLSQVSREYKLILKRNLYDPKDISPLQLLKIFIIAYAPDLFMLIKKIRMPFIETDGRA